MIVRMKVGESLTVVRGLELSVLEDVKLMMGEDALFATCRVCCRTPDYRTQGSSRRSRIARE